MAPPTPATAQTGYLKVPKFIPHAPLVWVQLCKAQFEVLQITDEQQKYNRILSSLSPEVIVAQVGDLIVTPFAAGHLEQLFDTIVEAFSASAIKRLRDVLDNEEQGDRKPSVFYKSMRTKVKDLNVSDDVFYDRWISRLDPQIQTTIAAAKPIAGMTIDQSVCEGSFSKPTTTWHTRATERLRASSRASTSGHRSPLTSRTGAAHAPVATRARSADTSKSHLR